MGFAHVGYDWSAKARRAYPQDADAAHAGHPAWAPCRVEHVLRYPPLWRSPDVLASDDRRRLDGAVERTGAGRLLPSACRRERRHTHIGHRVALATRADECGGNQDGTTEAGVAFAVGDGLAGFPASYLGKRDDIEIRVDDGSLRIKSRWNALRYLGSDAPPLIDPDGFVDTGDMVVEVDGRCYFVGRRNGVINIGGQKVHPEEIEAVINRHPGVRVSRVTARKSPITGAIVVADVVVMAPSPDDVIVSQILDTCRRVLARHKVPAMIRIVPAIEVAASGKISRV